MPIVTPTAGGAVPNVSTIASVNTFADVRLLGAGIFPVIEVLGGATVGDGQDGVFYWNSTSVTADDGLSVLAPSTGVIGRWIRLYSGFSLSSGASHVSTIQSGTGTLSRPVSSVLDERVSLLNYIPLTLHAAIAAGTDTTDLSTYIQAWLTDVATMRRKGYAPKGLYNFATGLSLTGNAATKFGEVVIIEGEGFGTGAGSGTRFKWTGTDSAANTFLDLTGIFYFEANDICFDGNAKVGKILKVTSGSYASQNWSFRSSRWVNAKSAGYAIFITGSSQCDTFQFYGCAIVPGAGAYGFYSENQNSLNHVFVGGFIGTAARGIWLNGGSFTAKGVTFAQNSEADIYLQIHAPISLINCWSEQSKQFIFADNRALVDGITLIGCRSSSYPWSYWKIDESGRTQPTNDYTQWVTISYDRSGGLSLIGTKLVDPYNGAVTGATAPTTSSTPTVSIPNGVTGEPNISVVGSYSQSATDTFTEQFLNIGSNQVAAPRIAPRKSVQTFGSLSGAFTANPYQYQTAKWTLSGNNTVTISTSNVVAGDRVAFDVTQNGTGGWTMGFVNAKTAGTFTPTAAAAARSRIEFEFDGTNWIEVARALNLA